MLFLQYVERGVFFMADSFICEALEECDDVELRFLLISRIADFELLVNVLWKDPVNGALVIQHFVGMLGIALPDMDVLDTLESADHSVFIPLTVFKEHVRPRQRMADGDRMIEFVYEHVKRAVLRGFGVEAN